MRIVFPYIAQIHQIPHSLPIAVELAERYPEVEVTAATNSQSGFDFIKTALATHAPSSRVRLVKLPISPMDAVLSHIGFSTPGKHRTIRRNSAFIGQHDAIVTPESTTLYLKRLGFTKPRLIRTGHGAGDREIAISPRIRDFDFVLIGGSKMERRMLDAKIIRPGRYATGVYAKFDWTLRGDKKLDLFGNGRPTVLYNPHFRHNLSSWPLWGIEVLDFFARSDEFNLIFAPHIRLFDSAMRKLSKGRLERFSACPNIHIDLGSERSVDMSYTASADIYLGDVSSQLNEFLFKPRPCLFLNTHGVAWRNAPSYRFWHMGPVAESLAELPARLTEAIASHERYLDAQRQYFHESFGTTIGQPSAGKGAEAIYGFMTACANPR